MTPEYPCTQYKEYREAGKDASKALVMAVVRLLLGCTVRRKASLKEKVLQ
jgi:hypothetical protein